MVPSFIGAEAGVATVVDRGLTPVVLAPPRRR
jgi:hypothetical protein